MAEHLPKFAAVGFVAFIACTPPVSSPGSSAGSGAATRPVRFVGCAFVMSGPLCVLELQHTLVLGLPPGGAAATIEVDGRTLTSTPSADGGWARATAPDRIELRVPDHTPHTLTLRNEGGRTLWTLAFAPADARALIDELAALDEPRLVARVKEVLPELAAGPRAQVLNWLARHQREKGELDASYETSLEAVKAAKRAGRLTEQVHSAVRASFIATNYHRFEDARAALDAARTPELASWPEGQSTLDTQEGTLARELGDFRRAFDFYARALAGTDAPDILARDLRQEIAQTRVRMGRFREALDDLLALRAEAEPKMEPDEKCDLATNIAWVALLAEERGPDTRGFEGRDPAERSSAERSSAERSSADRSSADRSSAERSSADRGSAERSSAERSSADRGSADRGSRERRDAALHNVDIARELDEGDLGSRENCRELDALDANIIVNRALHAMHQRRLDDVEALLARAKSKPMRPEVELWATEIERRAAIARGDAKRALRAAAALERAASSGESAAYDWMAALGRGEALELEGDREAAARAYRAAESILDGELSTIPLDGRIEFLADRARSSRRLIEVLLTLGRPAEALESARLARRRGLAAVARTEQLTTLSGEPRDRWNRALEEYWRERRTLGVDLANVQERKDHAQRILDEAYRSLGPAGSIGSSAGHVLQPGELLLTWVRGDRGWIGFARMGDEVQAAKLDDGRAHPREGDDTAIADWLFAPFRASIAGAKRIYLLPTESLALLDIHALPFEGRPLAARRSVVYGLDLQRTETRDPNATKHTRALIVSDPSGNLKVARREGPLVAERLRQLGYETDLISWPDADHDRVTRSLRTADWFHYAGHGFFAGREGWDSHLLLSSQATLTPGDILLGGAVPEHVVLSACEGAASIDTSVAAAMSLASAFVLAGSDEVLAAPRQIKDPEMISTIEDLYGRMDRAREPIEELLAERAANDVVAKELRLVVP